MRGEDNCAEPLGNSDSYHFFRAFFARSAAASLATRSAVRFLAAASDVFLERADRCSGVMFFAAFLPPCRPKVRAISVIAARTSGGILMAIPPNSVPNRVWYVHVKGAERVGEAILTS